LVAAKVSKQKTAIFLKLFIARPLCQIATSALLLGGMINSPGRTALLCECAPRRLDHDRGLSPDSSQRWRRTDFVNDDFYGNQTKRIIKCGISSATRGISFGAANSRRRAAFLKYFPGSPMAGVSERIAQNVWAMSSSVPMPR
jgi:hypothetical protein